MKGKIEIYNHEDLQWVNDLAMWRSLMGRVPWMTRFGQGKMKNLSFNEETGAGAWLIDWPEGYDPLQTHSHGGNEYCFILEGELHHEGKILTEGSYLYFPKDVVHGPLVPGKDGCVFLSVVDGQFFSQAFLEEILSAGRASRQRA